MRVTRKDNGVEWDVHPSYYENYKNDFIVIEEEVIIEAVKDVDIIVSPTPVKNKGGRPPKEK